MLSAKEALWMDRTCGDMNLANRAKLVDLCQFFELRPYFLFTSLSN